jgi:hypothetical protein
MEKEDNLRFSIDEIHIEEEEENIPVYNNMFMNSLPRIHPEHPNPTLRPPNSLTLAGIKPTNIPEVKKIAVINPLVKKPRPPSLFMKKVTY